MTGFFVKGDEFDPQGPEWPHDPERSFYTVGRLERGDDPDDFFWSSDHSLVTDSCGIALMWALAQLGTIDDGEHPKPLTRVVAHRTDPAELERPDGPVDDDQERTVAFVTPDGILAASEAEGQAIAAETEELSEIIKVMTVGDGP